MIEVRNNRILRVMDEPQQFLSEIIIQPENHGQGFDSPVHITIVADRSGSMSGKRIGIVKEAICQVAQNLRPEDRFSLIAFDMKAEIIFQHLTLANLAEINAKVKLLLAGGGTDMSSGLFKAFELVTPEDRNTFVVMSDGMSTNPEAIYRLADNAKQNDIPIDSAGIEADDADGQKILSETAIRSNGFSEYLQTSQEILPFLAKCLKTAQSNTWEHVTLEIQTAGGAEIIDFAKHAPVIDPSNLSNPTTNHKTAIGNISAEEPYKAIIKIKEPPKTQPGTYLAAKVIATYSQGLIQKHSEAEIKINFSTSAPFPTLNDIDKAYISVEAKRAEKRGDLHTTKRLYETIRDRKMTGLIEKIAKGTATTEEKVQFEAGSTRRK